MADDLAEAAAREWEQQQRDAAQEAAAWNQHADRVRTVKTASHYKSDDAHGFAAEWAPVLCDTLTAPIIAESFDTAAVELRRELSTLSPAHKHALAVCVAAREGDAAETARLIDDGRERYGDALRWAVSDILDRVAAAMPTPGDKADDLFTAEQLASLIPRVSARTLRRYLGDPHEKSGGGRGRQNKWHYYKVKAALEERYGRLPTLAEAREL